LVQTVDQPAPARVVAHGLLPRIAACHHVIDGAFRLDPQSARHVGRLSVGANGSRAEKRETKSVTAKPPTPTAHDRAERNHPAAVTDDDERKAAAEPDALAPAPSPEARPDMAAPSSSPPRPAVRMKTSRNARTKHRPGTN
jgi:hypothetical protein